METQARDQLARDRTVLALERTVLAYARTSLAFLASGVSTLHFLPDAAAWAGWTLIVLAAGLIIRAGQGIRSAR